MQIKSHFLQWQIVGFFIDKFNLDLDLIYFYANMWITPIENMNYPLFYLYFTYKLTYSNIWKKY